jgi:acyl-CoA reductase-like NAD-dependent aldehyde dehydrogenase
MKAAVPTASEFLSFHSHKLFIDGQWVDAAGNSRFETRDPGTNKVLAEVAAAEKGDIDRAIESAQKAFQRTEWSTMPANDRALIQHRLADLVDQHHDDLAQLESLDVGKPIGQAATFDIPHASIRAVISNCE